MAPFFPGSPPGAVIPSPASEDLDPAASEALTDVIDGVKLTFAELTATPSEDLIDPQESIGCSYVDLNLLAGSSDAFRNFVGGYFMNVPNEEGKYTVPPSFAKFKSNSFQSSYLYSVASLTGEEINELATPLGTPSSEDMSPDTLDVKLRGYDEFSPYIQDIILPYVQFVCKIDGDPEAEYLSDIMFGNKYWKLLFTGGRFLYTDISPIYNEAVYDDHWFTTTRPYPNIQKQYLKNPEMIYSYIELGSRYNFFVRNYQSYSDDIENEKELPNWYLTNLVAETPAAYEILAKVPLVERLGPPGISYTSAPDARYLNPNIIEYYTRNGQVTLEHIESLLEWPPAGDYEPSTSEASGPNKNTPLEFMNYLNYLNTTFVNHSNKVSRGTRNYLHNRFSNVLFNANSVESFLRNDSNAFLYEKMVPFCNKITFPTHATKKYAQDIARNDYSTMFLRNLKEIFLRQGDATVPIERMQYLKNQKFLSSSIGMTANGVECTTGIVEHRSVDYIQSLLYNYNKISDDFEDFMVMDYENIDTKSIYDTRGIYRAYNNRNIVKTFENCLARQAPNLSSYRVNSIGDILNSQVYGDGTKVDFSDADTLASLNPDPKYNEVLAYRIEKIGGPPSGDANTQNALQNFWIFNGSGLEEMNFLDTQVKYDTDYTYRVYAYYIVEGFKYKYSDLRISRIIGQVSAEEGWTGAVDLGTGIEGTPPPPPDAYCIEYYDPFTGNRSSDLLEDIVYDTDLPAAALSEEISRVATDAQRIAASAKKSEGGGVLPPYVAQFLATCQPSVRIVEIPIASKTYRILDNPPSNIDAVPYHYKDNSSRLNFELYYQSPSERFYPRIILDSDEVTRTQYLHARDYLLTTPLSYKESTISPASSIEVYRLNKRPKSFKEFSGNLYKTISLKIPRSNFTYTTAVFDDIVKSNTKYYYLFRAVNELGIPGNVETILEAELVNDGGYKYANFEVLFEEDLFQPSHKETSISFRKLIQLTPKLSQTNMNTTAANFGLTASEEYEKVEIGTAEELIWDKTFKIRLTSKKTGKKIDLNITYSDPTKKLKKEDDED